MYAGQPRVIARFPDNKRPLLQATLTAPGTSHLQLDAVLLIYTGCTFPLLIPQYILEQLGLQPDGVNVSASMADGSSTTMRRCVA